MMCPSDGYKIMDTSVLQELLNSVSKCTSCEAEKSLVIKQNNKKRVGMCETLSIYCTLCNNIIKTFQTTQKVEGTAIRSVLAATSIGGGLTILRWDYGGKIMSPKLHLTNCFLFLLVEKDLKSCFGPKKKKGGGGAITPIWPKIPVFPKSLAENISKSIHSTYFIFVHSIHMISLHVLCLLRLFKK